MDISRLPQKAYNMLLLLHNSSKFCWASQVHQVLYKCGFGFAWENQGVQNPETLIKEFKQKLIDCRSQNWHENISNSTTFATYRMVKISIALEPYLTSVTKKHIWDVLIRFRIGASNIRTHKLRCYTHILHTGQVIWNVHYVTRRTKMKCIPYFIADF